MKYQALYRRYRPTCFAEVKGQSLPVQVLTGALSSGRIGHAYLFSGPRGCGKTTLARLFAKAVNCESPQGYEPCCQCESCCSVADGSSLDVIEIDGASNNSVDQVRELKSTVSLSSFGGHWKIYIIDEVHMLTSSAFNALLKTLEEPPEKVMFILATTEPQKVPATIRSRCQHLPFKGLPTSDIVRTLRQISSLEGASIQEEILWELAKMSDGGMRDALSLLEQVLALGGQNLDIDALEALTGGTGASIRRWVDLIRAGDEKAVETLHRTILAGAVPERLVSNAFGFIRDLWVVSLHGPQGLDGLELSEQDKSWLVARGQEVDRRSLEVLMTRLASLGAQIRRGLDCSIIEGLLGLWFTQVFRPHQQAAVVGDRPHQQQSVVEQLAVQERKPLSEGLLVNEIEKTMATEVVTAVKASASPVGDEVQEKMPSQNQPQMATEVVSEPGEQAAEKPSIPTQNSQNTDFSQIEQIWENPWASDPLLWLCFQVGTFDVTDRQAKLTLPQHWGFVLPFLQQDRRIDEIKEALLRKNFSLSSFVVCVGDQVISFDEEIDSTVLAPQRPMAQLNTALFERKPSTGSFSEQVEKQMAQFNKTSSTAQPATEQDHKPEPSSQRHIGLKDLSHMLPEAEVLYYRCEESSDSEIEEKE